MKLSQIIEQLENFAHSSLQEDYDNSGLQVGDYEREVNKALICLDLTMEVLDEAISEGAGMIISHHPLIFGGLKSLTGRTETERIVMKAIKSEIAIYAIHTNLDNAFLGVNAMLAEKLGIGELEILQPMKGRLLKLATFCPKEHADKVREALFLAGAGHIGNYDACSYNVEGYGTFRAGENSDPFVGERGELHKEQETRIEVIFPDYIQTSLLKSLKESHPYEEVAYDIYPLRNEYDRSGAGMIGFLKDDMEEITFLQMLKRTLGTDCIRHSSLRGKKIRRVAICGGSGSFLISRARAMGADIFVTGDIKYHQFFEGDQDMMIADAGHYETEQFTKELIYNIINEKFPTFALRISQSNTNAVHYL